MYELKTKRTKVTAAAYIAGIKDEIRRKDCRTIEGLMKRVTGCSPKMWGPSIVGFDSYHYRYESGHEGEMCVVGFSSGKPNITLYLIGEYQKPETRALMKQLGKHKTGKVCLYIRRLSDVNLHVLEQLIVRSVAEVRRRYPEK